MPVMLPSTVGSFKHLVGTIPSGSLPNIKDGIAKLLSLSPDHLELVLGTVIEAYRSGTADENAASDLAKKLGISSEAKEGLMGGMMLLGATAMATESPDEIIEILEAKKLVAPSDATGLLKLVKAFRERKPALEAAVDELRLANAVLPSFSDLSTVVEVRFKFDAQGVSLCVPVAAAYLSTDAKDVRLWFQLSRGQVKGMIRKLERTLGEMDETEARLTKLLQK